MTATMRAVVIESFGGVEQLKIAELPRPEAGEGEVLVRVRAAGLNPVDTKIRQGMLMERGLPHKFPVILGWEMSGIVESCGYSARRFKPGDEVYGYCRRPIIHSGTDAEYIAVPESYVTRKPSKLSFEEAGAVSLAALTAYQSVYSAARISEGETALILGASGGVGSYAVQFCKLVGARVIAVASGRNAGYLEELGAAHCIDYSKQDVVSSLHEIAPGGADFVLDCKGGDALTQGYECVKQGGRLVDIVQPPSQTALDSKKTRAIYVFVEPNVSQLDHIAALTDSGELKTTVSRVYTMDKVAEAHEAIESGHTRGKMVLVIG